MKQLTFLSKFFFLALAISFMSSCGEDGPGGGDVVIPPVVALQSGADLVTSATTVDAGAVFKVRIVADKGDNDMTTFTVLEDGIAIDAARLNYNSAGAGTLSNPYTLSSGEATTFDTNIEITAHDSGTRTYTFRITDSANETDDTSVDISITSVPMAIGLDGSNGGITADATLNSQTNFLVQVVASKGGSPLSTLSVLEDGVAIEASRATFNTVNDFATGTTFPTNPLDLVGDEKTGINWFVWVSSHDSGTKTYTYLITDENGNTEEVSLDISIFAGTAVTELSGKLLKNAGGPMGTGGINLLTGEGTGSAIADGGHIKDLGIDAGPIATNWLKQIAPVGTNILRAPGMDFPVSDFDAVDFAEDIVQAYDNGTDLLSSDVGIGDRFLVRSDAGETFLVYVTNIVETPDNNEDYYELSIKF